MVIDPEIEKKKHIRRIKNNIAIFQYQIQNAKLNIKCLEKILGEVERGVRK
jgi:hypothetical protein